MKMKIYKMFLFAALIAAAGCETFDLDQTVNPSTITQDQNDPVFAFNYVQLQLPAFVNSANAFTQRVTRQMAMTGGNTYNNAFAPVNFDTNWTQGYLILNAIKSSEARAQENDQTFILGANKVMRCYVLMTLVDIYGNIPYSEALQGNDNLTPNFDNGADVYAGVYEELNQAIALLQQPGANLPGLVARDLYYGSGEDGSPNPTAWVTLAKTLKLKMLNNARLLSTLGTHNIQAEMQALVSAGDLILNANQDFSFKYGNIRVNPNSRHPLYNDHYELGGGAYIGNYFMWAVSREKQEPTGAYSSSVPYPYLDPRTKFYFFNQAASATGNSQVLPCDEDARRPDHYTDSEYYSFFRPREGAGAIAPAYCTTNRNSDGNSFWGRDHGDNSGIPLDVTSRTVAGLYPAGGSYGTPEAVAANGLTAGTKGALGEGIMPILMSSFTHFIIAEAQLTGAVSGGETAAKQSFIDGITDSIDRVVMPINGYPALSSDQLAAIQTAKSNYLTFMNNAWTTGFTSADQRLELIIKEYYIAAWGNGIEPYNNYRRTGYPSNFQPTLEQDPGAFFNSALYPGVSVNNNPNAPSNVRTRRVFWDVAGLTLH